MSNLHGRIEVEVSYLGSTGDNQVVKDQAAFVYGLTIGNNTTVVELSDHASDGDGNIKMKLTNPPCGYFPINAWFENGITLDIATAAQITVHYE